MKRGGLSAEVPIFAEYGLKRLQRRLSSDSPRRVRGSAKRTDVKRMPVLSCLLLLFAGHGFAE